MTLISTGTMRTERLRILLSGAVQGVGFRPMVNRLAQKMHLAGWVRHSGAGLEIQLEASSEELNAFLDKLKQGRPPAAVVTMEQVSRIAPIGSVWFEILPKAEIT